MWLERKTGMSGQDDSFRFLCGHDLFDPLFVSVHQAFDDIPDVEFRRPMAVSIISTGHEKPPAGSPKIHDQYTAISDHRK